MCRRPIDRASQLITVYDDDADNHALAESSDKANGIGDSTSAESSDTMGENGSDVDNLASAFQVKSILESVGEQWQKLLIERAQLASKAQKLEEENSRLKSSLRHSEGQCERLALALQQSSHTSNGASGASATTLKHSSAPRCTMETILQNWAATPGSKQKVCLSLR